MLPASRVPFLEQTSNLVSRFRHHANTVFFRHDTTPSLLELPLDADTSQSASTSEDATAKRATSNPTSPSLVSIASRIQSESYSSADELVQDVEKAASKIVDPLTAKEAPQLVGSHARLNPLTLGETRLMSGALALQKMAKNLATTEQQLRKPNRNQREEGKEIKDEKPKVNGAIEIQLENMEDEPFDTTRSVLTLYGNAPGPKQLFSSLQRPFKASSILGKRPSSELDTSVNVTVPIRDELLPGMISTTKILPVDTGDANMKKRTPTIGELFAPPASLPSLTPPKPTKPTATRGATITWEYPETRPKTRRDSYNFTRSDLSVGQWLGYRGVDQPQEPISPEAKRKQRDRALSTGEAQPKLSAEARRAVEEAKEDALFRSVYSSFAPTRDDSAAVIPAQSRDAVWWNRVGEKRFQQCFSVHQESIDPALMEVESGSGQAQSNEDAAFQEAIDNWEPEAEESYESAATKDKEEGDADMDGLLKDVSELLETVNSYQRIRNASLASHSHNRTPSVTSQQATVANISGSPTSPTSGEVDVYNVLKMQLIIMINQLPPYAVAKLNGDQLADLNISQNILIETKDYRGVLEEDQISRLAKAAVVTAPPPSIPRMNSATGQYTSSTPQYARPMSGGQLGNPRPQSTYFPQQQPPNRTPSVPNQRSSTTGQYATPGSYGTTGASRPNYNTQPSYQNQPRSGPGPAYASTPSSGNSSFHAPPFRTPQQFFSATTQAANQPRNYTQPAPSSGYQSRPAGHGPAQQAPMYGYPATNTAPTHSSSQSPHARTASPLKTPLPQNQNQQPRPTYQQQHSAGAPTYGTTSSASATSNGRPSLYHGGSQPATPSGVGPSGFHTSMSSAEQQSMMERQRAQLAEQQRQKANADQAIGSASPAPGANGQARTTPQASVDA